jgi:hypothetical protein
MKRACCPNCRLRFRPATAAELAACPRCGDPLQRLALEEGLGFRLFGVEDTPQPLPEAIAVSMPIPDPGRERS